MNHGNPDPSSLLRPVGNCALVNVNRGQGQANRTSFHWELLSNRTARLAPRRRFAVGCARILNLRSRDEASLADEMVSRRRAAASPGPGRRSGRHGALRPPEPGWSRRRRARWQSPELVHVPHEREFGFVRC